MEEITFNNCHIVAEELIKKDKEAAIALRDELSYQLAKDKKEKDDRRNK